MIQPSFKAAVTRLDFNRPMASAPDGNLYILTREISSALGREPSPGEHLQIGVPGSTWASKYLVMRVNPHETVMRWRPQKVSEFLHRGRA